MSITIPNKDSFSKMSIAQLKTFFNENADKFSDIELKNFSQLVKDDGRSGVINAFSRILKAKDDVKTEKERVQKLYDFQNTIAALPGSVILGLDEVGRGPLAGPLTVGGVILKNQPIVLGLNDSKKLSPKKREEVATDIEKNAVCVKTFSVPPKYIDDLGMTECLKRAFKNIVKQVEDDGIKIDLILLDGNPLSIDPREVNVVKGDAKCASISAASIIAKVHRDSYMDSIADKYPQYNFQQNKGYGTAQHIEAIKKFGLSAVHRKSFCTSFMQMSLF